MTPTEPPRATRAKSSKRTQAERRESSERRLLDAAAQVVAERGSAKASFAEIAAVAGQSHSHPHYLFGSKANMLEALMVAFANQNSEQVADRIGDATGLDAIIGVVSLFIRSLRDPLPMTRAFYVLLGESVSANPELRPRIDEYHRWLQQLLAEWLRAGVDAGEVRADVDVDAAAAVCLATVRGIGFLVLNDPDAYDLAAIESQTISQLDRTLRAAPT